MIDHERWQALSEAIDDPAQRGPLLEQVSAAAEPDDIDILMRRCVSSEGREARAAIRVLHTLLEQERLSPQERLTWEHALKAAISREPLNSPVWALAHLSLEVHGIEHRAEDRALRGTSRDEYLAISAQQQRDRLASNPEIELDDAIRQLIAADPAASDKAERLRSLADAWRTNRDPNAIHRFYVEYIETIGAREVPLRAITDVLGRPTDGSSREVSYHVTSGSALYLEADSTGRLSAHKLS